MIDDAASTGNDGQDLLDLVMTCHLLNISAVSLECENPAGMGGCGDEPHTG